MIEINNGRRIGQLSLIVICAFCVILSSPFFSSIGTETVLVTMISCVLMFYYRYKTISASSRILILLNLLFFAIIVAYKLLGISSAGWVYAAGYMGWMFATILGCYLVNNISYKQLKVLFGIIYLACVAYCSYIAIMGNRIMQQGSELGVELTTAMYSTAFMLFSGSCLILFLNIRKRSTRVLAAVGFIVATYANFAVLQRGANAIFSLVLYILIILFNSKRSRAAYGLVFAVIMILLIVFQTGLYTDVLDFIVRIAPSERIASRINSLNIFLQTGDYIYAGTSVRTRGILLNRTWTTFTDSFSSIMVGIGDHRSYIGPIGNHNEIVDMLARYGIVFSMPLYFILFKQHNMYKELINGYKKNKVYHQATSVFLIYLARNIIGNAFSTAVAIQMFIFLPIIIILIETQNVQLQ